MHPLTRLGVVPGLAPSFAKRIILTNLLGMLFTVNMSVSAFAFLYFGHGKLALFTFFFVLTEISWPIFNHFGRYDVSRVGMLVSSNLLGFAVSVMLPDTGYNRGFYVMAGLPILLFGFKEKRYIILGFLLPLVLYPISEWAQYQVPFRLDLPSQTTEFIRHSIGAIYVLLIFLMFLFLSSESEKAEKSLKAAIENVEKEKRKIIELNQELEEQRARSFSSAKFAALGEMASGIGHEINNPMMAIGINAEQIKQILSKPEIDRERAIQKSETIKKVIQRVADIVESMRNFSREGLNDPLEDRPVSQIIDDTLIFCSERFKSHSIKFAVELPEVSPSLRCRPVQLSQILLNLLNNAFDAVETLPEKWIRLEVTKDESLGKIRICVIDSGRPIPEEIREKIFQPFYTTKPVGKGTGLGLSLSRKIAQQHGGELTLDPTHPNTRFTLELPVC